VATIDGTVQSTDTTFLDGSNGLRTAAEAAAVPSRSTSPLKRFQHAPGRTNLQLGQLEVDGAPAGPAAVVRLAELTASLGHKREVRLDDQVLVRLRGLLLGLERIEEGVEPGVCPRRKPPFLVVKSAARPYRSAI
jgi:hypothetical protein